MRSKVGSGAVSFASATNKTFGEHG